MTDHYDKYGPAPEQETHADRATPHEPVGDAVLDWWEMNRKRNAARKAEEEAMKLPYWAKSCMKTTSASGQPSDAGGC